MVFSKCSPGLFANNKFIITFRMSKREIWRRNEEFAGLISEYDVWCHTSRVDVKTPIVGKRKQNQS